MSELRWIAGDPAVRTVVEDWWVDPDRAAAKAEVLRDNPRRRLVRLDSVRVGPLLIKHYRLGSGRHRLRERVKAWLRRSPPDREFRTLVRLREAGVAVPPALARGSLPGGDRIIVVRFVEGMDLGEAIAGDSRTRRRVLVDLGQALAGLHERGFVHGDLHAGNVLWTERGAMLVDLQHARSTRARRARIRDLARLDYSLWANAVPLSDRVRLRAAALRTGRPWDRAARKTLRRIGRAADARAREHAESRQRRALRPGRRFGRVRLEGFRGLRLRELEEAALADTLTAHREALIRDDPRVLKNDGRSRITRVEAGGRKLVVKEVLPRGLGRRIADAFRGSAARRAWIGGHGLQARWIAAATPMAFLERRKLGLPAGSLLVLEDVAPAVPADTLEADPATLSEVVARLGRLARDLHHRGADHGDLKASHVYLDPADPDAPLRLLDLEGVRFAKRIPRRRRLLALAQLNASLPDRFPDPARCQAFDAYARALPLGRKPRRALRRVVRTSLRREHRWTAPDCPIAR